MQKADCRDEIAELAAVLAWLKYKDNIDREFTTNVSFSVFLFFVFTFVKARVVYRLRKNSEKLLRIARHFEGVITPDFSTYQDFPDPIKRYATYRMRIIGFWLGKNGISIINNVRWGTPETYQYCFDGIQKNSTVAIGTVGGSPRKLIDRERFNNGINYMVELLRPRNIIVYGSSNYDCFKLLEKDGIQIISYPSKTSRAFKGVRK